ncbi:carboxypeptidase-like regulatory domain-containing protein [Flavobacterium sp. SM15]|uniref:carboxypeptidase-like regulatory domain-containing protein n=1 Tax=Flavobacterium sp. SM15 TaxID=2908005 RepID=UPI001EDC18E7|nr:carboxypeptidase-like regulatory domain-containing protein [Flavobacterium sp. SM15]MCG2611363.1 carboxypeptidase-like regulatory domain-containing protein [Flavobacterium sp. SM15]
MKQILSIVLFISLSKSFSQTKISGIVRDGTTKEPLAGASIFAPNTTNGGATNQEGLFSFTLSEHQNEVLITYVGYDNVLVPASSLANPNQTSVIYLNPVVNQLKEVVISKMSAKEREKHLETFKNEFIGRGKIAEQTKIVNPEVLNFQLNTEKTILTTTADVPIVLINEKTGYEISYNLVFFESKTLKENNFQKETVYFGYPFFKEIIAERKLNADKISKTRQELYKGSILHFMRSLFNNSCKKEGFTMRKFKYEPNPNYPTEETISKMWKDYKENKRSYPEIPSKYIITHNPTYCNEEQLIDEKENRKLLYFEDYLSVVYKNAKEETKYIFLNHLHAGNFQRSQLKITSSDPIEIFKNGSVSQPQRLATYGYMGWKKVGELLPFDYNPEVTP